MKTYLVTQTIKLSMKVIANSKKEAIEIAKDLAIANKGDIEKTTETATLLSERFESHKWINILA